MALSFAAALLTVAVVVYVVAPILQNRHAPLDSGDALGEAHHKKRVALMALRDAEYDRATGKLDDADYQALRAELSSEALAAIRHEEALGRGETGPDLDARPDPEPAAAESTDAAPAPDLEAEIARVRAGLDAGTTCTACGHLNRRGSNFCTTCGRPLRRAEPPPPLP